jgi:hypothetical protein
MHAEPVCFKLYFNVSYSNFAGSLGIAVVKGRGGGVWLTNEHLLVWKMITSLPYK